MIHTARLFLRCWRDDDAPAHNVLANDPRVAATLGAAPTDADSRNVVARQQALQVANGHCFWVIEHDGIFAGWCGLKPGKPPIEGEAEIGWTLAPALWGRGLAYEAAAAVLAWAWVNTRRDEVLAMTALCNTRSRALRSGSA